MGHVAQVIGNREPDEPANLYALCLLAAHTTFSGRFGSFGPRVSLRGAVRLISGSEPE